MNNLIFMKPFRLFAAILLPFLVSSILFIIIQPTYLYTAFERLALRMVDEAQSSKLRSMSANMSMMRQTARSLVVHAFFDDPIKDLLYTDVKFEDYPHYINRLSFYKNIYPFVDSIYIYAKGQVYMMPSAKFNRQLDSFYDSEIADILGDMRKYKSHDIIPRRIPYYDYIVDQVDPDRYKDVYSYLFYESQLSSGVISEAIILNISADWIWQGLEPADQTDNPRIFMIDIKGRLVSKDLQNDMLTDLSNESYIRRILASGDSIGNFRDPVEGVDSFIAYTGLQKFGWILVTITPYRLVMQNIDIMKTHTLFFAFLLLLLSMAVSILLSRRLFIPIQSLITHSKALESQKFAGAYQRRQDLLRELVQNDDSFMLESINARLKADGSLLNTTGCLLMLIAKIDYFHEFCDNFNLSDRRLLKFGAANIISEILLPLGYNECVDVGDDQLVVLMNYGYEEAPEKNGQFLAAMDNIRKNVKQYLSISLSFAVGDLAGNVADLNYQKTAELANYRLLMGHGALIFPNHVLQEKEAFEYPTDREKMLIDHLRLGHTDEARQVFLDFMDITSKHNNIFLNPVLIRLVTGIAGVADMIANANKETRSSFNFTAFLGNLQRLETIDEITDAFFELFDKMQNNTDQRYAARMAEVEDIIRREYADPNLSLEMIADRVSISSSYLSRLFRKYKNVSITGYISGIRLEKVCEALVSTDRTIGVVMQEHGFLSRGNFFTLFKKTYGMTPSQYRDKERKNN